MEDLLQVGIITSTHGVRGEAVSYTHRRSLLGNEIIVTIDKGQHQRRRNSQRAVQHARPELLFGFVR